MGERFITFRRVVGLKQEVLRINLCTTLSACAPRNIVPKRLKTSGSLAPWVLQIRTSGALYFSKLVRKVGRAGNRQTLSHTLVVNSVRTEGRTHQEHDKQYAMHTSKRPAKTSSALRREGVECPSKYTITPDFGPPRTHLQVCPDVSHRVSRQRVEDR